MEKNSKNKILELIKLKSYSVEELATKLNVSKSTIRKKLKKLETKDKININKEKKGRKYFYRIESTNQIIDKEPKENCNNQVKGLLYFSVYDTPEINLHSTLDTYFDYVETLNYLILDTPQNPYKVNHILLKTWIKGFPTPNTIYNDGKEVYLGTIAHENFHKEMGLTRFINKNKFTKNIFDSGIKLLVAELIKKELSLNKFQRKSPIYSIIEHNGKIIDSGEYGLYDTFENKALISKEKMKNKNVQFIDSLMTDNKNRLFGLCIDNNSNHTLRELNNYSIGDIVLDYGTKPRRSEFGQPKIIPYGGFKGKNGKDYDFSVLSCIYLKYLDLNGEKIEGSEVEEARGCDFKAFICSLDYFNLDGKEIDVVYSGQPNLFQNYDKTFSGKNEIYQAKIDLENKKIIKKKGVRFDNNLGSQVYGLNLVKNKNLHDRLIDLGLMFYRKRRMGSK